MHFGHDDTTLEYIERLNAFMAEKVYPAEATLSEQIQANVANDSWEIPAVFADLKVEAQARGLRRTRHRQHGSAQRVRHRRAERAMAQAAACR